MASRLILRIQEKQARLTSGEKKIAQTILENQDIIDQFHKRKIKTSSLVFIKQSSDKAETIKL